MIRKILNNMREEATLNKIITLPHKACGFKCTLNGLEDLYESCTGIRIPDGILYTLSGLCEFVFIKQKKQTIANFIFWSSLGKTQIEFFQDIFNYKLITNSNNSFESSLEYAINCIDNNIPMTLGPVDLYHLPYYEGFYHKIHSPFHYFTMVGYDESKNIIYLYDSLYQDRMGLSFADLEQAWNVTVKYFVNKYTMHGFDFNDELPSIETIIIEGLKKKSINMLRPKYLVQGVNAIRKLANDFTNWPLQLEQKKLNANLRQFVLNTASTLPTLPQRLVNYKVSDIFKKHHGSRDVFSKMLFDFGNQYNNPKWLEAASLIEKSGYLIEEITEEITNYLLEEFDNLNEVSNMLYSVADLEEKAFLKIIDS